MFPKYFSQVPKASDVKEKELPLKEVVKQEPLIVKGKRKKNGGMMGQAPPNMDCLPVMRQRFRFYTSSSVGQRATPQAITSTGIFGTIGSYCTVANTTVRSWAGAFRIRRVTIYPAVSTTDNSDAEISWYGADTTLRMKPVIKDQSLPMGQLGLIRKVTAVPPKDSLSAFWFTAGGTSNNMFGLWISQPGSIVDLDLEWVLFNATAAGMSQVTISVTTASLGVVYFLALDDPSGTTLLQPVGRYPTTT